MKESEAIKKWCPMVRMADCGAENASAVNRIHGEFECTAYCIGSECMMWESWEYEKLGDVVDDKTQFITMNKGEGDCGLKSKNLEV
jgi:hypothetical protein